MTCTLYLSFNCVYEWISGLKGRIQASTVVNQAGFNEAP